MHCNMDSDSDMNAQPLTRLLGLSNYLVYAYSMCPPRRLNIHFQSPAKLNIPDVARRRVFIQSTRFRPGDWHEFEATSAR